MHPPPIPAPQRKDAYAKIPLAGLAASLSQHAELTVIPSDLADLATPPGPDDVVIVDAAQAAEALAILRPHPVWSLFSVDAVTGKLTAYVAQSHLVQGMEEIVWYLTDETGKQGNGWTRKVASE